ncbi:MAG: hypothetical protein ACRYGL_13865 [Janthinobacterium lividum]
MTETTFPDHPGTPGVVLLPSAIAENAARGTALALAFARRGWDVGVYYDDGGDGGDGGDGAPRGPDRGKDDASGVEPGRRATALALCATVMALGRRAAAFPVSTQPSVPSSTCSTAATAEMPVVPHAAPDAASQDTHGPASRPVPGDAAAAMDTHDATRAETLVQRCTQGLGRPRCVVSAPLRVERDVAGRMSSPALVRMNQANLWTALALAQTLSDAIDADGGGGDSGGDGAGNGGNDAVVVNIVDSILPDVRRDAMLFALTQSAVATATPALARRYAPHMRVVAVSTPLLAGPEGSAANAADGGNAADTGHAAAAGSGKNRGNPDHAAGGGPLDASLAQAVCYLAEASTITGSTLLVDGGMGCALPVGADIDALVRHVAARERSRS